MKLELLLLQKPQPRKIGDLLAPVPPTPGDNLTRAERVYKVLEVSWTTAIAEVEGDKVEVLTCAVLLGQIAGPPHLETVGLAMAQQSKAVL